MTNTEDHFTRLDKQAKSLADNKVKKALDKKGIKKSKYPNYDEKVKEVKKLPGCLKVAQRLIDSDMQYITLTANLANAMDEAMGEDFGCKPSSNIKLSDSVLESDTGPRLFNFHNGDQEKGRYVDGFRHGNWVLTSAEGDRHEGKCVEGLKHGHWTLCFADGRKREGEFDKGREQGQWVECYPNGDVFDAIYKMGTKVSEGKHRKETIKKIEPEAEEKGANTYKIFCIGIGLFVIAVAVFVGAKLFPPE